MWWYGRGRGFPPDRWDWVVVVISVLGGLGLIAWGILSQR
jgi:hypothetical protein